MKILALGTDNSILDINSPLTQRARNYSELTDRYDIIVPSKNNEVVNLSPKVVARGVAVKNKLAGFFRFLIFSYKVLKKEKYDLITVQDPYYLALIGLILRWRFGIGLHLQLHGWEKFGGLRALISRFVLPRADAIRTVSQRLKRQLIDEFGVKEERITVVPIFVERVTRNVERVTRNVERVTRNDSKFVFLTVGRLVPVKNIKMQIEAIKELKVSAKGGSASGGKGEKLKVELWIVGEGKERKNLEFRIQNLGIENNVKLLGYKNREELCELYKQADAFLLTSYAEGWPLVIVEAASFGLPIIMTDVGSAGELIKNGENGIIIPIGNTDKLISTMIEIFNNEELRKKIGEGARRAVSKLPSKEEILRLYKKSWQKAMDRC